MPLIMNPKCPGTCNVLTWRNANNVSILLGYTKYPEDVKQQKTVKKVYAGSSSKKKPLSGSLLHVCACVSIVPYPGRV